ncbi:reverse transcriptase domain-containing protein [Tanacetum coccineum]
MPCSCDRRGMWERRENVIIALVMKWLESEDLSDIDIKTLTLEQYLALNRNNSQVRVKRREIKKSIVFEIKSQLLKELRENTFSGGKAEDSMEHLRKILEIASLFNTPGISGNDIMLQNFLLTLTRAAKRWLGRTPSDLLKTWDELKQVFIQRFWLTAIEALESIQEKADHSHIWHKEESDKKTSNKSVKLPPKEKDPGSFVLPCVIGNTTVSNALANLGASISVMPFSMFKRLALGNPIPVNMIIEMADRSMHSPKGIVENVIVKIHKFIFLVDFIILDIVEDNKVPIILGRPMLATAHARIDVFGGKILLEVGKEQVIFNANEGATPITISPVCVIRNFNVIDDIDRLDDLEEFLMNDNLNGDLGNFLQDNKYFQLNLLSYLDKSSRVIWSPTKGFQDFENDFGSRIDELVAIDDLWGDLDSGALNRFVNFNPYIDPISPFNVMSRAAYNSIMKRELTYTGNNIVGKAKNL